MASAGIDIPPARHGFLCPRRSTVRCASSSCRPLSHEDALYPTIFPRGLPPLPCQKSRVPMFAPQSSPLPDKRINGEVPPRRPLDERMVTWSSISNRPERAMHLNPVPPTRSISCHGGLPPHPRRIRGSVCDGGSLPCLSGSIALADRVSLSPV